MALALVMNSASCPLETKRRAAAAVIEDLVAFLDDTDGDCDLEPSLGFNEAMWHHGVDAVDLEGGDPNDEGEATNEDGGDVLDEPHDELDEGNEEISLGWGLQFNQLHASAQACRWGEEERWGVA